MANWFHPYGTMLAKLTLPINKERMKQIMKCDVCGCDIEIVQYRDKICKRCGWIQNEEAVHDPNKLIYPNITSLNNAKELIRKGKKIKPTFEDFIESVRLNLEPTFKYNKKQYGSTNFSGYEFYEWNKEEGYQSYQTIEEFEQKVNIDGKLLKDVWQDVHQFELGC